MKETFAIPAVGAIIVKKVEDEEYILVQNRKKNNGDGMDGLSEIPAGKIREYENIFNACQCVKEVFRIEDCSIHFY